MPPILAEVLVILALLLVNGLLAMSELAIVTARPARLARRAKGGDRGAAAALDLAREPTRLLSTVQVGITLVGILAGAFGGATLAQELTPLFERLPGIAASANEIALAVVVVGITYLSLVVGELVPKRIALANPERIAARVARPLAFLARIGSPLVRLLSGSTNLLLRVLRIQAPRDQGVTDDDVRALVAQGRASGAIHATEEQILVRALRLGERTVGAFMTPRTEIEWLDLAESTEAHRAEIRSAERSRLPVGDGSVDQIVGVVETQDLLRQLAEGKTPDLRAAMQQPLFVPETTSALRLLELFRTTPTPVAIVLDEFGGTQGLVTLTDLLADLVTLPIEAAAEEADALVRRADGSWLVDGQLPLEDLIERTGFVPTPFGEAEYHTVAGLVLSHLGRVPRGGERLQLGEWTIEVVDMDGRRIDRLLLTGPATLPVPAKVPERA